MKRNRRVYDPTGFQAIQNITDETRRFYKLLYTIECTPSTIFVSSLGLTSVNALSSLT